MKELLKYNDKRNFEATAEPKGELVKNQNGKLVFAVQHHIASRDHFDFRLEWGGVLLSWAVPKGPSFNPKDRRLAIQVEDHPYDYKDFEGVIPKSQYGGGTVMLWDYGYYVPLKPMDKALEYGLLEIELRGQRLKGSWNLIKGEKQEENQTIWFLAKGKDEYASEDTDISAYDTGVLSGKRMDEIAASDQNSNLPFEELDIMLALLKKEVPHDDENWLYEIKYDGYRIVAFIENGKARLLSRNKKDYTQKFLSIAQSLEKMAKGKSMVLDGEIVVIDEKGKPDFQALQNSLRAKTHARCSYVIFDIMALGADDLRQKPLTYRKEILNKTLSDLPKNLQLSNYVIGKGRETFELAKKMEFEGIVGKKADSQYSGNRNGNWIKLKCYARQELVVGGFVTTAKEPTLSCLLLGYYEGEKLIYAGRVGTGFTESVKLQLREKFSSLIIDASPFEINEPKPTLETTYLQPKLVAEVQFAEWTGEKVIRQGSFKGLREDKTAKDIVKE